MKAIMSLIPRHRTIRLILTFTLGLISEITSVDSENSCTPSSSMDTTVQKRIRFPAEWENHTRTFMAWPASADIWEDLLPGVREDIANLAKIIARFEPVVMLVKPDQVKDAEKLVGSNVKVVSMENNDLWARDILPVFVEDTGSSGNKEVYGVDFNFNGWGNKQEHDYDSKVAKTVLSAYNIKCIRSAMVGEGGGLETDGQGTLLATESSWVNDNRNPGKSRDEIEKELKKVLGVTKVIWFEGVKGEDITDAHVDALARFASPGVVVLSRPAPDLESGESDEGDVWERSSNQAKLVLANATDAKGNPIRVVELFDPNPDKIRAQSNSDTEDEDASDFLSSYANYYVINRAVIVPEFGDQEADRKAQQTLKELYPGRQIVPVRIDNLAQGGGGIHCATHDEPARSP